ncbi:MAG: glycosyltransferase family 1 protein [Ardenticatenales bacterium]|nr:glycosyltransferase family 1 protein [Ardenticatenales bacterium]
MRIALFTEVFHPKIDGITHTLGHVLRHLEAVGIPALVVTPRMPGLPARFAGAEVVGLPAMPFPLYPELRLSPPWHNIDTVLDAFAPDVLHIAGPVATGLIGIRYGRRRGLPMVMSYHTDIPGFAARWGHGWLAPTLWRLLKWGHGQAALNLAPSHTTAADLVAHGFPNVAIWSRGVDTDLYGPHRRRAEVRAELSGGHPDAPLLAYVGRLSAEKRIDWITAALDACPEARLAIVGDGPARPVLERAFAGRNVVFTGFRSGIPLAEAYAAADVFVFPGANETLGNVVLEALASGLPVVVPDAGGVLEHVRDGITGRLFRAESRASLAAVVRQLVDAPNERARLADAANAYARTRGWGAENARLVGWYEGVVAGGGQDSEVGDERRRPANPSRRAVARLSSPAVAGED